MNLKMTSCGLALIAAGLLATACQTPDPTATKFGSGVDKVSVKFGTTRTLAGFYSVNDDCSSPRVPAIKVLSGPAHGTVNLSRGSGRPAYSAAEPRHKCNSRNVAKVFVNYTPASGYLGKDTVSVSSKAPGQTDFSYVTFDITISQ